MLLGNQCKLPRTAVKKQQQQKHIFHVFVTTYSLAWNILDCRPAYLNDKCMCIGDLVLWGHMLLHSLTGAPDSQQDECVGKENDSAGHNIAEEEEADDVAQCCRVLAGSMPIDAACRTIWLCPIFSPARQGTNGENCCIAPDPSNQHAGMKVGELATWGRKIEEPG